MILRSQVDPDSHACDNSVQSFEASLPLVVPSEAVHLLYSSIEELILQTGDGPVAALKYWTTLVPIVASSVPSLSQDDPLEVARIDARGTESGSGPILLETTPAGTLLQQQTPTPGFPPTLLCPPVLNCRTLCLCV